MVPWLKTKSEDQSGDPPTNLQVFGDEVGFQYFQKTWKSIVPVVCKTKSCQSSRESIRMVHAVPLDIPRPPKYNLKLSKNVFVKKSIFSFPDAFVVFFCPIWLVFGAIGGLFQLSAVFAILFALIQCLEAPI